jgi:thioredoxin-related protein
MIKKILTTAVVITAIMLQHSIAFAQQIDYVQAVKNHISATVPREVLANIGFEVREVLDTKSPNWKVVIVYIKEGRAKQPIPFFISKDGRTIVPASMVFVDNKPIFTKQLHPEFEKIDFRLSEENRIVYNPQGSKTVFMFSDPECPYCIQVKEKLQTYAGSYRIVLKHFPLPHHPNAKEKSISMQIEWLKNKGIVIDKNALRDAGKKIVTEDMAEGVKAGVVGVPFFIDAEGNILDIIPILREIGIPGV